MHRMSRNDRYFAKNISIVRAGYSEESTEGQIGRLLASYEKTLATEEMCVQLLTEALLAYRSALRSGESESEQLRQKADFALSQLKTEET